MIDLSKTTLTEQQKELIECCTSPEGRNYVAVARAGTAKTTTATLAAEQYNALFPDHDIVGFAFNRLIANDLAAAMPFATVKTGHGFGYGAWMKRSGKSIKTVNKRKNFDIKREMDITDNFPDFIRAMSICKAWGMVPHNIPAEPTVYMAANQENMRFIFDNY